MLGIFLLAAAITSPVQPGAGPGGADYRHAKVVDTRQGHGGTQCWIFEPAAPTPTNAPVVIFLHGWSAMYPSLYDRWIIHLVRRGNIVIYPRYQGYLATLAREFTSNTVTAVQLALSELKTGKHVRPDLGRVAVVGHSIGGAIAANLAVLADQEGLPALKAVMCIEPGDSTVTNQLTHYAKADWSKIPAATLLLTVVGEDDKTVRDAYAKLIFRGTPQIPAENKDYIIVHTDRHGKRQLVADHRAPFASSFWPHSVNALDYYAFWKLFDALTDTAFYGKNREFALGNTPQQRFMGRWSDGVPVKELSITNEP
jgi:pimeloyl-ACP methyl ester carboxylesterase